MGRLESYENYMSSAYAYFKFLYEAFKNKSSEDKNIILEENYINGAKIAFLANILTGIKEDIVSKENGYSPKVLLHKLEETVDLIAVQTPSGYKINGYNFSSAAELVSIIRNKIAHGKYSVDLDNNLIIFHLDDKDISISIRKFSDFVVSAIANYLKDQNNSEQVRHITHVEVKDINNIKTESAIRGLIKNIHAKTFEIRTKDGSKVGLVTKKAFDKVVELYKEKGEDVFSLKEYKDLCNKLQESENIEFIVKSKSFNYQKIEKMIPEIKSKIFDNDALTQEDKIRLLLNLLEKSNNLYDNKFSNLIANFDNLILIDAIEGTYSVDENKMSEYLARKYSAPGVISGEQLVSSIIALFNPSFQYLFDEIYVKPGEYSNDRNGYFDFSKLNTYWIKDKNMFYTISDKSYLEGLKLRLNKICNEINILHDKLIKQKDNLANIDMSKPNSLRAVTVIKEDNFKTTMKYQNLVSEKILLEIDIDAVENDLNSDYFKNRAVIEGIRNSISHGNYEIKMNYENPFDSIIIFKDIYEGKETFKLEITAYDFMQFILNNVRETTLFVQDKLNSKKKI